MTDTPADRIEALCIEAVEENLVYLCVHHFRVRSASTPNVLAPLIMFLEALQQHWEKSRRPTDERTKCLGVVADLLSVIGARKEMALRTIHGEATAAYLLFIALKNERVGRPLLDGVKHDVFLRDSLYPSLLTKTKLHEIAEATRCRYLGQR